MGAKLDALDLDDGEGALLTRLLDIATTGDDAEVARFASFMDFGGLSGRREPHGRSGSDHTRVVWQENTEIGTIGPFGGHRAWGRDACQNSVMTELARCRWCRKVLPKRSGPGRPREFCGARCRQWDWVARQRARELELSDGELVIARAELDALHDDLYVLACAVDDVDRDLTAGGARISARELRELLDWILVAARPLRDRELSAPDTHGTISS